MEAVLRDVRAGFVDVNGARDDYGVVIAQGQLDEEATRCLRDRPRPPSERFDLGPERTAWDRVFTDERMGALVDLLLAQPPALATRQRGQLFSELLPELGQRPLEELLGDPEEIGERLDRMIAELSKV